MELLKIDNDKLKITLTREDMRKYALNFDKINYDNTETRRAFWTILDDAKHETGFDAATDKVSVQVYGSSSGGCEMFVTRLSTDLAANPKGSPSLPIPIQKLGQRLFGFHDLENLLSACKMLGNLEYFGKSSAYYDKNGYYLLLADTLSPGYCRLGKIDLLSEFGTPLSGEICGYIVEHTLPICLDHAVGLLAKLAV